MEQHIKEMKRNYQENFKPDDFHKLYQEELFYMQDVYFSSLKVLYEIMRRGKFKGRKLLEIGSGPTIHNIASASAYFPEIVQSDFVEANCEELRRWLGGKSQLDWSPFLEAIARIEGYQDLSSGIRDIEVRIRRSVQSVVHCDVLADRVIPEEVKSKFDLILTSLTLECAAPDFESFLSILMRLNQLLCVGGGLIMIGFLNGKKWKTVGGEFHYLSMDQSDIDRALDICGFKEKEWTVFPKTSSIPDLKFEYFYIVGAVKSW